MNTFDAIKTLNNFIRRRNRCGPITAIDFTYLHRSRVKTNTALTALLQWSPHNDFFFSDANLENTKKLLLVDSVMV